MLRNQQSPPFKLNIGCAYMILKTPFDAKAYISTNPIAKASKNLTI